MRRYKSLLLQDWQFAGPDRKTRSVRLPHTWNSADGQDGGDDYYRGTCTYCTRFASPVANLETECVYLEFEGVNSSADITLNGRLCCHHDGGYSTFRVDVTEQMAKENTLEVTVDNGINDRVYPQKADFTFYGGIYRDVKLLIVNKKHFDLDYYGGQGARITPVLVGEDVMIIAESWNNAPDAETFVSILDADGDVVKTGKSSHAELTLKNPHKWNGMKDPYLYTALLELKKDGSLLDEVRLRFGVRSFYADKNQGFFLNGKSYPLHGVSRHQDRKRLGNALTSAEHDEDLALIHEVGANSVRLAHYQQSQYFYDRCDEMGLVVWAEIPYISQHMPKGRENSISQMKELIIQNYHHPSIMCWGVSNEITIAVKDKADMLNNHYVLNRLCHDLDPTRLTTLACYAMCGPFNKAAHITDLVGWNLYLGWYVPGLFLNDLWIGFFHLMYPKRSFGYSEYGCEGMPNLHAKDPKRGDHTEEYQAKYHEFMLRCFRRHPYMWCNYVWNMFDFAADARDQGGEPGMNHKGLVTFDRQIKKDSFFLYKAFWSDEPFVHIAGKRMINRTGKRTRVAVYTNQPYIMLYVDGRLAAEKAVDKTAVFVIPLSETVNIEVKAGGQKDTALFHKVEKICPDYNLIKNRSRKKSNWI